ncbi:MAG: hypothetical protein AVDCRST_MAG68-2153, partial [uncultured Gemmatimonadetes bacterium]
EDRTDRRVPDHPPRAGRLDLLGPGGELAPLRGGVGGAGLQPGALRRGGGHVEEGQDGRRHHRPL